MTLKKEINMTSTSFPKYNFTPRTVEYSDLDQLMELEKIWPEKARASYETLKFRIDKFQQGFFVGEDETGILGSIICHPYHYHPADLSNYQNWEAVVKKCYANHDYTDTNALYIVAGTSRPSIHGNEIFDSGMVHVVDLAKKLNKRFVIGGCVLPRYARYASKHANASIEDYVFKKVKDKCLDPLLEKYRRHGFHVPDKNHIISNYFLDDSSLNYSALVVKNVC